MAMRSTLVRTRSLFPECEENPWNTQTSNEDRDHSAGLTAVELCAGGGGQALGLEAAGLEHVALVDIDGFACETLRSNRPSWAVFQQDLNSFEASRYKGVDIVCGGLPCPPFSVAGKQLGVRDERNLFPALVRIVDQVRPRAVMIENVRGILDAVFEDYRFHIAGQLKKLGYTTGWKLMNACEFGVPQLRPRVVFISVRQQYSEYFSWPQAQRTQPQTVGEALFDLMAAEGWIGAKAWRKNADEIAPTIVGGSHKHGGPDLGPTRARRAWATLGVDGLGIANAAPNRDFVGLPRLTLRMVARLQGFPDTWTFAGKKTRAYRQVGNAFPPPFARAVGRSLSACLQAGHKLVSIAG